MKNTKKFLDKTTAININNTMKYTQTQIAKMRTLLAQRDIEQSEDSTLFDVFMEGCTGWGNFEDDFVIEQFEEYFGEDYFEVIDEKDHKNGLYGE